MTGLKKILPLLISIVLCGIIILLLSDIFYFNKLNLKRFLIPAGDTSYVNMSFQPLKEDDTKRIFQTDNQEQNEDKTESKDDKKEMSSRKEQGDDDKKKDWKIKDTSQKKEDDSLIHKVSFKKTVYSKGSGLPDQQFHSYGEFISDEEHAYRLSIIQTLKIKTVVIDCLTEQNGIAYEFFKVAYESNMIPAKILEKIVESKEFRELIPQKYIKKESTLKNLDKGDSVVFLNTDIKRLLLLWASGRLAPIAKAWRAQAEK